MQSRNPRAKLTVIGIAMKSRLNWTPVILDAVVGADREAAEAFRLIIVHGGGSAHGKPAGISVSVKRIVSSLGSRNLLTRRRLWLRNLDCGRQIVEMLKPS
jgi:hypothetical protein